jgi:hypothetical protein
MQAPGSTAAGDCLVRFDAASLEIGEGRCAINFGRRPALQVARYFCYVREEQSEHLLSGVLCLVHLGCDREHVGGARFDAKRAVRELVIWAVASCSVVERNS